MSDEYYTRITVPLSREEFTALSKSAQKEYRHPREQARFILRSILLGNKKGDAHSVQAECAVFAEPPYPPCLAN